MIQDFKHWLHENGVSDLTITAYGYDIKQFLEWNGDIGSIGKAILIDYCAYLETVVIKVVKKQNVYTSPASMQRKLSTVKRFIEFLNLEKGYNIKYTKKRIRLSLETVDGYITNKDVKRMLNACDREIEEMSEEFDSLAGRSGNSAAIKLGDAHRDKALLAACFYTGSRITPILNLKVTDIDKKKSDWPIKFVKIKGKDGVYHSLYFPDKLLIILKEYLKYRYYDSEYLFTSNRGQLKYLRARQITRGIAGKARRIRLDYANPHKFRGLYTRNLENMKVGDTKIGQLTGHSLTMNQRYGAVSKQELYNIVKCMDIDKMIKLDEKKK